MKKEQLLKLLSTESSQLKKLNDIVIESVEEEKILSQKLYESEDKNASLPDRLSDKVASLVVAGNLSFYLFYLCWYGSS